MKSLLLIGNLTADPELKTAPVKGENVPVCTFNLAVNEINKEKDATFFQLTAWRTFAENISKYCKKGDKIYVRAIPATDNYEKDGVKHYGYKFTVDEVEFLTPKEKQ